MDSDTVLLIIAFLLLLLFAGEPDLHDALISKLTDEAACLTPYPESSD